MFDIGDEVIYTGNFTRARRTKMIGKKGIVKGKAEGIRGEQCIVDFGVGYTNYGAYVGNLELAVLREPDWRL